MKIFLRTTSRDDEILLWHKTIDFRFGDLNAVFNTTDETFQNDGINHVSKCIGALSDGCNANDGVHSEVTKKLLQKLLHSFKSLLGLTHIMFVILVNIKLQVQKSSFPRNSQSQVPGKFPPRQKNFQPPLSPPGL